ncbi:CoA transferase [uncultured Pigmentiphaga sp.]|jgi:Predicted acyl-CoA transferases/carnitine dehydratase|uniref:CaiB/BaiF CoA transferase family protein n=1 Tax=uncultured Pigmentiphaga sp. TaxID=340361 RepID=UPI0026390D40|nr:CoA transferase [uncultured Pigmentiphaga sp.]
MSQHSASGAGALAGIRVLDLTSAVVGPYASKIMADNGADVIKVESSDGDVIRWIAGPSPTPGMSGKFLHLNRGKRSIVLDLKKAEGREAVMRLVAQSDVLLINMRPKAVERLGLAYENVSRVNPRLVYCAMVGFGPGPYRDTPAYDSIIQGGAGVAALSEMATGEPRYVPYVVADRTVGLMALNAVLMALLQRERTGAGQQIEVPMFENMAALVLSEHLYGSTFDPPLSPPGDLRLIDPEAKPVKTLDGYICLTTNTDAQAFALMRVMGRPEMQTDPRFSTKQARAAHSREYFSIRAQEMAKRTTAEWLALLKEADIPAMPYNTLDSLVVDPHIQAAGVLRAAEHPTEGRMWDLSDPTYMSARGEVELRPAPTLGQHGAEILAEAGYTPEEIESLSASGVLGTPR